MRFGDFYTDYPRLLEVIARTPDGRQEVLLTPADYAALRDYVSARDEFLLEFSPISVQSVIFRQVGRDPVFDWSIAEIDLYEEAR
jgi:hypothetical protein